MMQTIAEKIKNEGIIAKYRKLANGYATIAKM